MPKAARDLFSVKFSVGGAIDFERGVLNSVTVAEVGAATGHFACIDRDGKVLGVDDHDIPGTAKKLPLYMDAKGLDMVVSAGMAAKRVKAREDHDDSIGARAGFASNFRIEGGKAVCDLNTFDEYRNRALFLEAADKTPEMVGLSGEFRFDVELVGDRAYMRVVGVEAVDIVDEGALTHAGLFRAIKEPPTVDRTEKPKSARSKVRFSKTSAMANAPKIPPAGPDVNLDPDGDGDVDIPGMPDMDAFKALCEEIGAYATGIGKAHDGFAAKLADCMAAINPVKVPTPPDAPAPVTGKPDNPDASVKDANANFAALRAEFKAELEKSQVNVAKALSVEMKRQFSALGIKPAAAATPTPELTPKAGETPPNADEPKTFLQLKAKIQKERKLKASEAMTAAMSERPELYQAHIKSLGIYDPEKDPTRKTAK